MDTWLAYAPVKNNPEDAAKVKQKKKKIVGHHKLFLFSILCYLK
jgi:hypothetical protein